MIHTTEFSSALETIKQDPAGGKTDPIHAPFWSMIIEKILDIIRQEQDIDAFLESEKDLIDFGICPEIWQDKLAARSIFLDTPVETIPLEVETMSGWLSNLIAKILQGDKKDLLIQTVNLSKIKIKKLTEEMNTFHNDRANLLINSTQDSPGSKQSAAFLKRLEEMNLQLIQSMRMKKAISRGVFFSVSDKRDHFDREIRLQKELTWFQNTLNSVQNRDTQAEIKKLTDQIAVHIEQTLDLELLIEKTESEIEQLTKQQQETSPLEIQSRIRKEMEYIRDLVKLSAKRMHTESMPIVTPDSKVISFKKLKECLDRIIEFDPKLFHNDRVNLFGKPRVLLVPGTGNSIYDWKNNLFLVPLTYMGTKPLISIASGVIEYRLDVDDDQKLLTSYHQLPDMKSIRSNVQLKAMLTKDYITWMTSEYLGYRVLSKESKNWFEHEIAPDKNEIYTLQKYQPFAIKASDFQKMIGEINTKIEKDGISSLSEEELWGGSMLIYQSGKFDLALQMLEELTKKGAVQPMVYYNIGQIATKCMKKQQAIAAFNEFLSTNAQGWWGRVVQTLIQRLQMS